MAQPGSVEGPRTGPTQLVRKSAAFQIIPAKRKQRYLKMLIYGDYGVGKTYLSGSAIEVPEMRDVIFITAEAGDLTLEEMDIDLVPVGTYRQFARVHEYLKLHCQLRDKQDTEKLKQLESQFRGEEVTEPKIYRTVVIDSLTEIQKMAMYQLLGIQIGDHALDIEPENPQIKEWGTSAEMIRLLVRTFRDLPMNVIFVCAQNVETDDRKRRFRTPALPGKLSNEVQGFLDVVGYYVASATEGGEIQRRLYLQPGQTYQAKNRFPGFHGSYLDNPTMADIYNLNKGRTQNE